jgi:hypothetical protein
MVLTYINSLNKNYKGERTYEFLFSKNMEIDFGEDWDVNPASSGTITPPPLTEIVRVAVLKTDKLEFDLATQSEYFSMYDCVEKIIALGWESESPENENRLVFHFGEDFESVKAKLYSRDIIIEILNDK